MPEANKVPVKTEEKAPAREAALQTWRSFGDLRREVDRLFEDFGHGFWSAPFRRTFFDVQPAWGRAPRWAAAPAVDIVEKEKSYEIRAELPGLDEKNIEVKVSKGGLTIRGEKQEEKDQKKQDYYLHERSFGAFERSFPLPEAADADKIEASFKKGVLTVTVPKKPEAIVPERKIEVKPAS
jgi:HSP20 family protein